MEVEGGVDVAISVMEAGTGEGGRDGVGRWAIGGVSRLNSRKS